MLKSLSNFIFIRISQVENLLFEAIENKGIKQGASGNFRITMFQALIGRTRDPKSTTGQDFGLPSTKPCTT